VLTASQETKESVTPIKKRSSLTGKIQGLGLGVVTGGTSVVKGIFYSTSLFIYFLLSLMSFWIYAFHVRIPYAFVTPFVVVYSSKHLH
jgi:hypothetical protein